MSEYGIEIRKVKALRAALHIRSKEEYQAAFTWIKLEAAPEGELGRMLATDGFSLLISEQAHDSPETVLWRPVDKWKPPVNTESAVLSGGVLTLHRKNGKRDMKAIEVLTGDDMPTWPDVDRVLPAPDAPRRVLAGPVSSIRGGRIAEAYFGSLANGEGAWVPMPGGELAELYGTEPGDTVVLVPLRGITQDDWPTVNESEPTGAPA